MCLSGIEMYVKVADCTVDPRRVLFFLSLFFWLGRGGGTRILRSLLRFPFEVDLLAGRLLVLHVHLALYRNSTPCRHRQTERGKDA